MTELCSVCVCVSSSKEDSVSPFQLTDILGLLLFQISGSRNITIYKCPFRLNVINFFLHWIYDANVVINNGSLSHLKPCLNCCVRVTGL